MGTVLYPYRADRYTISPSRRYRRVVEYIPKLFWDLVRHDRLRSRGLMLHIVPGRQPRISFSFQLCQY